MFTSEFDFENHIRQLIANHISTTNQEIYLLQNKDIVDMLVCNDAKGELYLLEAKFYTKSKNRLGFGSGNGEGFQPEILSKRPVFFNSRMRWIFGKENDDKYYIFSNSEIANYFSGNALGKKQNNFQIRLYSENNGKTETEFIEYLKQLLL
jgi:hypothetical protein